MNKKSDKVIPPDNQSKLVSELTDLERFFMALSLRASNKFVISMKKC